MYTIIYLFGFMLLGTTAKTNESKLALKVKSLEQQLSLMECELNKTKESNRQLMEILHNQNKEVR